VKWKILSLAVISVFFLGTASAESFGSTSGPLPNVTQLEIYDVKGLSTADKETEGSLEDSGLNKTFKIRQSTQTQYRFSFKIVNEGDQSWDLATSDELFHEGLNNTWSVDKTWYNISQDYDGGSFSDGKVSWDIDADSVLDPSETMYAKYLVTIDGNKTFEYDQRFEVNDTSNSSGSFDEHRLRALKYGHLEVDILEPPNDTVLEQNKTFKLNGTAKCVDGRCGEVSLTSRYNTSNSADTAIPQTGEPFNTNKSNPSICDSFLTNNEQCSVEWFVNASGSKETFHKLDVLAESNTSLVNNNDSVDHLAQINSLLIFDLTWDTVDFGTLDPGAENKSATGNNDRTYNISVSEDSETIDDMWIRSTDLNSTKFPENYSISAENMSYSLQNDIDSETPLSNTYQLLKSSISPGAIFTTYYWMDVPFGIYKGEYNGTIYFKANSTG
jgi:hypothetical protein